MDATNANTALASALAEELARCGARHAVISPGSRSTPLALALWRERDIAASVVLDERSAGFVALGAAHAGGTPAVVLCTSGTAAANLHPAVCEAHESNVPLIVLTADRPPELRDVGAGQTIDQLKLYGDAVRWFCEVGTHEADDAGLLHLRSVACRAFAAARGDARPGPVHLNLAWREPLAPTGIPGAVSATSPLALEGRAERPLTTVVPAVATPSPELLEALEARIAAAPRGLIVAGRQSDPELARAVASLAAATGYPVLAEPTSQLRRGPHAGEHVLWAYEPIARARPPQLEPQLVIRVGEMPTCKPLRQWLAALDGAAQIALDPRGGWNEPTRKADAIVRADPATTLAALATAGPRHDARGWHEAWRRAHDAAAGAIARELDAAPGLTQGATWRALGELLGEGDLVYTASSMPIRDQEVFMPAGGPACTFLANRGANGIDGLVSSGAGAALATGRPAWIVTGDLGLVHDMNGLAALPRAEPAVRVVVLDNQGGRIFEQLPQAAALPRGEFDALFTTPSGLGFERIAYLHELPYVRVADRAGLHELAEHPSALLHLRIDPALDLEVRRSALDAATRAATEALGA